MLTLLKFLIVIIVAFFALGYYRTYQMQHNALAEEFSKGSLPILDLDGFYKGSANFPTGPWLGKSINKDTQSGVNILGTITGQSERFHFKTSTVTGLQDKNLQVVKLDYDLPGNSFIIKPVLDEVVETAPGKYLGKVHFRLPYIPPFTLAYFRLEK